ncbi:MAG TPA: hypothetical protein VIM85_02655 [Pseudomonadales bacterium]
MLNFNNKDKLKRANTWKCHYTVALIGEKWGCHTSYAAAVGSPLKTGMDRVLDSEGGRYKINK